MCIVVLLCRVLGPVFKRKFEQQSNIIAPDTANVSNCLNRVRRHCYHVKLDTVLDLASENAIPAARRDHISIDISSL